MSGQKVIVTKQPHQELSGSLTPTFQVSSFYTLPRLFAYNTVSILEHLKPSSGCLGSGLKLSSNIKRITLANDKWNTLPIRQRGCVNVFNSTMMNKGEQAEIKSRQETIAVNS